MEEVPVEISERQPGVAQAISRAAQDGHVAAETGEPLSGRDVDFPFGIGVGHVSLGRSELNGFGQHARLGRLKFLLIDNVHGEGFVAIGPSRQRDGQPVTIQFGFDWLMVHGAAPELGGGGQAELLELFVVVLHHE